MKAGLAAESTDSSLLQPVQYYDDRYYDRLIGDIGTLGTGEAITIAGISEAIAAAIASGILGFALGAAIAGSAQERNSLGARRNDRAWKIIASGVTARS